MMWLFDQVAIDRKSVLKFEKRPLVAELKLKDALFIKLSGKMHQGCLIFAS